MTTETKKTNWFVRILIILLCFFIGGLIYFNFFCSSSPLQISGGVLILISFLTLLVLSEAFDNFSISKLITLSRAVKEKENKNQELNKENIELRNQIISISTSISQNQVNSPIFLTEAFAKSFAVKQANEPEREEKRQEIEEIEEKDEKETTKKYITYSKLEDVAFPRFLQIEGLDILPIIRDAKLVSHFHQIDPVSEYSPIFDGYIKKVDAEIFIEMKVKGQMGNSTRSHLYMMLSKINYYRTIKKVNAFLYLVLIFRPDDEEQPYIQKNKILQEFEPAITNGLLQVKTIKITQQEYDAIE